MIQKKLKRNFIFARKKNNLSFFCHTNTGDYMFVDIVKTDWIEVLDVILRSILSLVTLFLVTKMLGKKQVSQLSLFDYVIGISIGNFAAEMTINTESQYMNGIVSVVMFGLVAYIVSIITMKSIILRRYFMGVPTILIQKGKILEKNMRKVKFDMNDLLEEIRNAGYFNLEEVEYAIMEANGKVSVLPKAAYKPVTVSDLKLNIKQDGLVANVIIDSKIMSKNLENMHKSKTWLEKQLKQKGYATYENILLATLDENDKVVIYEKNLDLKPHDIME